MHWSVPGVGPIEVTEGAVTRLFSVGFTLDMWSPGKGLIMCPVEVLSTLGWLLEDTSL